MSTLLALQTAIQDISKNHYILDSSSILITSRINDAVNEIAGGILLHNRTISPPLPELYETATVATSTSLPYVSLPATYQRSLFHVASAAGVTVPPPDRCDYYGFAMFVAAATSSLLDTVGAVSRACVKGLKLYYQGVPAVSVNLGIMFYRKPVAMVDPTDVVDGIPDQFQTRLIKHYIGRQLAKEMVDGTDRLAAYHAEEFERAMLDMVEFIGTDGAPTAMRSKPVTKPIIKATTGASK